jgi:hypothetical protein
MTGAPEARGMTAGFIGCAVSRAGAAAHEHEHVVNDRARRVFKELAADASPDAERLFSRMNEKTRDKRTLNDRRLSSCTVRLLDHVFFLAGIRHAKRHAKRYCRRFSRLPDKNAQTVFSNKKPRCNLHSGARSLRVARFYFSMPTSSTSKVRSLFGGIGPTPRSP